MVSIRERVKSGNTLDGGTEMVYHSNSNRDTPSKGQH